MRHRERILSEQAFHDMQAAKRSAAGVCNALRFCDDAYLDHETWIRPAFRQLGELSGKRALDFGCGHGMAAVVLSRRGGHVTAFDLSGEYLKEARTRAEANGADIEFVKANGEALPFADDSFDCIWGNAILHHLDMTAAGRELYRVTAASGVAVFCEPWGDNWLLNLVRKHAPYAEKDRTIDECPLTSRRLNVLRNIFPSVEVRGFQLVSMPRRVVRNPWLVAGLDRCDALLLRRLPQLQRYCRYAMITLRK